MKTTLLAAVFCLLLFPAVSQDKFSLTGTLRDSITKKELPKASVVLSGEGLKNDLVTNPEGQFVITGISWGTLYAGPGN